MIKFYPNYLLLLLLLFHTEWVIANANPDFTLAPNGVTCLCPDAAFGDTGTLNIGGTDYTFTKRTKAEIQALAFDDPQIALSCTSGITDMAEMFSQKNGFNQDISSWDVSNVTTMLAMFGNFFSDVSFNQPLNDWDVSNVQNMRGMFVRATAFNQPLNNWDTSSLTTTARMFEGAASFNNDISSWDVSNVTDMGQMFQFASAFNLPLDNWDVSSVTNMANMFYGNSSFNQPLNSWNVSNVTNMASMFFGFNAGNPTIFNQPLNNWDVSNVSSMNTMFAFSSFNQSLNTWDVSSVTSMFGMFFEASAFNQDLSNWCVEGIAMEPGSFNINSPMAATMSFQPNWGAPCDFYLAPNNVTCLCPNASVGDTGVVTINGESKLFTKRTRPQLLTLIANNQADPQIALTCTSGITDMGSLFNNATGFNQDISSWDTSSVLTMESMFILASAFNQDISDWDVSNVNSMATMFFLSSAFNQDISSWDVSSVTNMNGMFAGLTGFPPNAFNQPLNTWDVSSVTGMNQMFQNTTQFNQPLNSWDTSSVVDMSLMFDNAFVFNQPLNDWDVSNVTNMANMFGSAFSFDQPLNDWDVSNVSNMSGTFANTISFNQALNNWDVSNVSDMSFIFFNASLFNQDLSNWCAEHIAIEPSNFATNSPLDALPAFKPKWGQSCFYLADNGVTCRCPHANVGDTGILNIGGVDYTFTKRLRADVDAVTGLDNLINTDQTDPQIALTCTSGITDMTSLFENRTSFNQDISWWDVSNVTNMDSMFDFATSFNQPLNNWDVSNVTIMFDMFTYATSFNQPLSDWDVSNVENMARMFHFATAFNSDISTWDVSSVTTMNIMFSNATDFNQPLNNWNVSSVTDMTDLFLATQFNQPLNNWDVSSVTNMQAMFNATPFNQDISSWDVSNVTNMQGMFSAAFFNQPLNDWDVSNVTNMNAMFLSAYDFNQPLNDWDVSNVESMVFMFGSPFDAAPNLTTFNQALDNWDVSNVTAMDNMFRNNIAFNQDISNWCVENIPSEPSNFATGSALQFGNFPNWGSSCLFTRSDDGLTCLCPAANFGDTGTVTINGVPTLFTKRTRADLDVLIAADQNDSEIARTCTSGVTDMSSLFLNRTIFNQDISSWDVSNVQNMAEMFRGASAFNQPINNWNVSNVTNMAGMFFGFDFQTTFNQPLSAWDVSKVTDMNAMFQDAVAFDQPLNTWDVSQVTNMFGMFFDAPVFNQPLDNWDVSSVTNMGAMFGGFDFQTTFNQPLQDWDVSQVTDMASMFQNNVAFNQPLNNWDTSSVTTMFNMFNGASSFNRTINDWDTSNVTTMVYMFGSATSFDQPLNDWDTSSVSTMEGMFFNASAFNQSVNDWDVSNVNMMYNMFGSATSFNQPLNLWNVSSLENMSFMFAGATSFNQPLNNWNTSNVNQFYVTFANASSFNQPLNDWDTSNVTIMGYMFGADPGMSMSFNQPLNHWDTSAVTDVATLGMTGMFVNNTTFDQDISNWCVLNLSSEPVDFGTNAVLFEDFKPRWGEDCVDVTWEGTADSDWNNASNWTSNTMPTSTDDVAIRTENFQPMISGLTHAETRNLIVLDGNTIEVSGVLKTNNLLHNNGIISFTSDINGSGQIDEFTGSLTGSGEVKVERYIPQSNRAFRYLGSSLNTFGSINDNLQEGVTTADANSNPHPGFGTHITGGTTTNGFDATSTNNPSMFEWNPVSQNWQALTQTLPKTLNVGEAYALMIRGDRSTDLSSNESLGPATTLRFRGDIQTGDFPVDSGDLAQTVNEFSLLVNPYQAIVDMKTLLESTDASGLDSQTIYVYDPTLGSRGGYATIDLSLDDPMSTPFDDGISGATNADENLQPNQAFFIKTTALNPSLTFKETYKNTTGTFTDTFSDGEELSVIHMNLKRQSDLSLTDGVTLRFNNNWNNAVDDNDAIKFWNYDERLAIFNTNTYLAIEKRATPQNNETIQLYIANYTETDYLWQINLKNINREVFLYDAYLDTETPLQQNAVTDVTFSTDASLSESTDPWRFSLKFGSETLSQNQEELSQLSVYPNPVTDYRFRITGLELQKNTEIELIDVLGRSVFKSKKDMSNETGIRIDPNLQAGVYQLIISQGNTSYYTKLIIKN